MKIIDTRHALEMYVDDHSVFSLLPSTAHDSYQMVNNKAYAHLDIVVCDGMPLVFIRKLLGNQTQRLYGPDLLKLFTHKYKSKKHLFLGSSSTLKLLEGKLKLRNAMFISLPFASASELVSSSLVAKIIQYKPDFIWLGVGSPKQVEVAHLLRNNNIKSRIFCVGAAFDFVAGTKSQAPVYLQKIGFEWLYRLVQEPSRLWIRYVIMSPIGVWHFLKFAITNQGGK
jgi:N-acetylglucosaminyldiphosphoundecaprenol N-acetyl-beta-D-mannosaminyltransferase